MAEDSALCLSENELLAWAAGRLPKERIRALDHHVDGCEQCHALVAEALRHSAGSGPAKPSEDTFEENELVAGRYRVVRFLARGGMGEVYEVYDLWLKDTVALKTLIAATSDDASALARLKAEVLIARRISHPNVCRVFDFGLHDRRTTRPGADAERVAFFTMELLRGETLKAHLQRVGSSGVEEALPIVVQMVAGMAHAHAAGIIHRDFKSENVMLVEDSQSDKLRVVVTDFGLARSGLMLGQPLTSSSHGALGTLDYMAPEQLEGKPVTQQSDIYALGVVLFEMMTGRLPFEGDSPVARALRRVHADPPRPGALVKDLPPAWEAAILKCLAPDPVRRFQHVDDLVLSIDTDSSPSARLFRRTARVPWLLAAILMALVALAVGVSRTSAPTGTGSPASPSGESAPEVKGGSTSSALAPRSLTSDAASAGSAFSAPALQSSAPPSRTMAGEAPKSPAGSARTTKRDRRVGPSGPPPKDAHRPSVEAGPAQDGLLDPF